MQDWMPPIPTEGPSGGTTPGGTWEMLPDEDGVYHRVWVPTSGGGGPDGDGGAPGVMPNLNPGEVTMNSTPINGYVNTLGNALANGGRTAASAIPWGNILRYGLPVVGGAINNYLQNRSANRNREEQARESNQRTAVQESELDPYRGTMHQTQDIARLDRMSQPPPVYGAPASSPYASSMSGVRPATPSALYMSSARNAQAGIARNDPAMRVPTMLNEANWGQTGTTDLTQSTPTAPTSTTPTSLTPPGAPTSSAAPAGGSLFARRFRYLQALRAAGGA